MGPLRRLCCCFLGLWGQLARASLEDASRRDASALVQREAQLSGSSVDLGPRNSLGPQHRTDLGPSFNGLGQRNSRVQFVSRLARNLLNTALAQLHVQMVAHEDTVLEELEMARNVSVYLKKIMSNLGRRGTLYQDVAGIFPRGPMDKEDRRAMALLLGLLRERKFATALLESLKTMSSSVQSYRWRAEKRVAALLVHSANATDQKMPLLVKNFFGQQNIVFKSVLKDAENGLRTCLAALPSEYATMRTIGGSIVNELMGYARGLLESNTEAIVQSRGSKFCSGLDLALSEELLPLVNESAVALESLDGYARGAMPEVANETAGLSKVLSTISTELTLLHHESVVWIERVCGLIGAMAVPAR